MKNLVSLFILTLSISQLHAQFGVMAGMNLNHFEYYSKSASIGGDKTSFHAGILYRKKFKSPFIIQPALLFSVRGGTIHDVDSTINTVISNIELPVNFLYVYKKLMLGVGPSFNFGIVGQMKSNGDTRDAYNVDETLERSLKRFELCGNVMIAYQFTKHISLAANYSVGLSNIYKGDGSAPPDVKARTSVFSASVILILPKLL